MSSSSERSLQFTIAYALLLLCSLSRADGPPSFQYGPNPYGQESQQPQQTLPTNSPLLRTFVSRLESAQPSDSFSNGYNGEPTVKPFLKTFMQHLETRRASNQSQGFQSNYLGITIRDGSTNLVNIEFENRRNMQQEWGTILDLLADSLAFVIQEAERLGYIPHFKYSVDVDDGDAFPSFGPALSGQALKSAVG